jgi:hypothetical protein
LCGTGSDAKLEEQRHYAQPKTKRLKWNLVTAVETHFWWPNLPTDMRQVFRVLKTGGKLIVIAEIYKGANTTVAKLAEKNASRIGMALLDVEEHRALFAEAGYAEVQVIEELRMDLRNRQKALIQKGSIERNGDFCAPG